MTIFNNNIGSIEDCYMGGPLENTNDSFNFGQDNLDMQQQLVCDPSDLTYWSFSRLPSPESPFFGDRREQHFGALLTPNSMDAQFFSPDAVNSAATNRNVYDNSYCQQTKPSDVALAIMNSPPRFDTAKHVEESSAGSSQLGSPANQSFPATPLTVHMHPAWEKSRPSRKSSSGTPRDVHKRTKSYDETTPASSKSSSSRHNLRSMSTTITNASSRPSTASAVSCGSPPKHARLSHNQVEKQYRNRLNGQFETLLLVLPREEMDSSEEKKVSKAEVLVLARKYIKELGRERRRLEAENDRLGGAMSELKRARAEAGGVALP